MGFERCKQETAAGLAADYWQKYVESTEPDKRHMYALKYEFWANVRDGFDPHNKETGECER